MKRFIIISLFSVLNFLASGQVCSPTITTLKWQATPDPCEDFFLLDDLPDGFVQSLWVFDFANDCYDETHIKTKEWPENDFIEHFEYNCFRRQLNSLSVTIEWRENSNTCYHTLYLSNNVLPNFPPVMILGGSNNPNCDDTKSILSGTNFSVSYSEFGLSPCITTLGNHVGLALTFDLPNLCWENCSELLPEVTICWTDGCIDYIESFNDINDCIIINPVLVGSQYTVSISGDGNCCSAPFTGSRTLTAQYDDPCPLTNACDPLCPNEGPYELIEGILECAECDPPIGPPIASVDYTGQTGNLYNFSGTANSSSQDCEIVEYEWKCWRYSLLLNQRELIPCIPGNSATDVSIDISPYCNGDAVGACLIAKDDCECSSDGFACENGPQIVKDPCDFDVVFSGVGPLGELFFFLSPDVSECAEVTWSVTCNGLDVPFSESEGGIIVAPTFDCFSLTVCASVPGCPFQCTFVSSMPQALYEENKATVWNNPTNSRWNTTNELKQGTFNIHPNPADNYVRITMENEKVIINQLSIYKVNGQEMNHLKHLQSYQASIDVSHYTEGLYFIQITEETGQVHSEKFVVQH